MIANQRRKLWTVLTSINVPIGYTNSREFSAYSLRHELKLVSILSVYITVHERPVKVCMEG